MAAMAANIVFAILTGILVHVVYLASIFDIYFTSPLVHGMEPYKSSLDPPAQRLVLFVADGLRADKFFELNESGVTRAPFLRHIIEREGCWGVSHTRVPTESRPGHVALIAGFYEDVSAVAKGWKENPVEFDSVFNESRNTWSWGSPDILPMFAKGASRDHIFTLMYEDVAEDFGNDDGAKLDLWVFDEVKKFFQEAKTNATLMEMLSKDKIVFFLHLLGIDTNGHSHRPSSKEYLNNIASVDNGIREMVELIDSFYKHDGQTAYVLTADHGMTNWGSHGAGHAHETLTPLTAWGAGIRGPLPSDGSGEVDGLSREWNLSHLKRADVNQADIAPLMTSLLGIPFPLNSVGILPVDYLNNSEKHIAENLLMNSQQVLAQYLVKESSRKETSLVFRPFRDLAGAEHVGLVRDIKELLRSEKYKKALRSSKHLIDLALEGLHYYQNYDRIFLNTVVTLGFVGWIIALILQVVKQHTEIIQEASKYTEAALQPFCYPSNVDMVFGSLAVLVILLLLCQSAPWMYYTYCLLPLLFWDHIFKQMRIIRAMWQYVGIKKIRRKVALLLLFGFFSVEILVQSFFTREILSVGLLGFALWPLSTNLVKIARNAAFAWMFLGVSLAVFPLLPVLGRESNYSLVMLAGVLTLVLFMAILALASSFSDDLKDEIIASKRILLGQFLANCASLYIVNNTASSLRRKEGLPLANQIGSWVILCSAFLTPLFSSSSLVIRLTSIALGFMSVYLLMSTAFEGLFLLVLSLLMASWLYCEHKLSGKTSQALFETQLSGDKTETRGRQHSWKSLTQGLQGPFHTRTLTLQDLRCAYFFVYFIIVAFFGTGNIASINSFEPASVYCFLTVFSPFTMGSLLLCKVLIPFIVVTCVFDAIHVILQVPVHSLFVVVLIITDTMGLHFFYLVQDYGTWLEIGTSISHFVIMMAFIIFLIPIFGLARLFTGASITLTSKKLV